MPNKLWALALLVAVALAVTFIVLYATADTSGGGGGGGGGPPSGDGAGYRVDNYTVNLDVSDTVNTSLGCLLFDDGIYITMTTDLEPPGTMEFSFTSRVVWPTGEQPATIPITIVTDSGNITFVLTPASDGSSIAIQQLSPVVGVSATLDLVVPIQALPDTTGIFPPPLTSDSPGATGYSNGDVTIVYPPASPPSTAEVGVLVFDNGVQVVYSANVGLSEPVAYLTSTTWEAGQQPASVTLPLIFGGSGTLEIEVVLSDPSKLTVQQLPSGVVYDLLPVEAPVTALPTNT